MLAIVYGGLTYLGATSLALGSNMSQADLLVAVVNALLGDTGMILLSVIVLLACVTTAVALVSSAADFFCVLFKGKVSYNVLLLIDCIIGVLICDIGLDNIISLADPVLGIVYPPFITVVVLLLFHEHLTCRHVYQGAAIGAFLAGVALELHSMGTFVVAPLDWLPLYSMGLGWITFAIVGGIAGWAMGKRA